MQPDLPATLTRANNGTQLMHTIPGQSFQKQSRRAALSEPDQSPFFVEQSGIPLAVAAVAVVAAAAEPGALPAAAGLVIEVHVTCVKDMKESNHGRTLSGLKEVKGIIPCT